ncbi:MAG TPA: hypothetical protein VD835_01230 [Pyrinomonadaceae bacterium]|nr:hypothetical protein [Pyrinomonadaceae bacterium]
MNCAEIISSRAGSDKETGACLETANPRGREFDVDLFPLIQHPFPVAPLELWNEKI